MPRHRLNFDNVNDGIDWEHALPPHVIAQREASRPPPPPAQYSRTLVFDWPLPENHPALQQQQPPPRRTTGRTSNIDHSLRAQLQPLSSETPAGSRREMIARRDRDLVDVWTGTTSAPVERRRTVNPQQGAPVHSTGQRHQNAAASPQVTTPGSTSRPQVALPELPERRASSRSPPPPSPPPPRSHVRPAPQSEGRWELQDFSYDALLELGSLAVPTGLGKDQLAKMKAQPFGGKESVDCAICLDDVCPGDPSMKLVCQHVFHPQCIVQWLARTNRCPTCRCEIRRKE